MNPEFARLAAARRIMRASGSTGSIADDRANAERWIARFGGRGGSDGGTTIETRESSVLVRPAREDPGAPRVLYVHGGGMVYYSTAVFLPFLQVLATELRAGVEAFDYLKAPEHTVEESVRRLGEQVAARCAEARDRPLVIAGDSVGGLLALYLALRVVPGAFSRIVLIYPMLDLRTERESYRAFGEGYFLDSAAMRRFTAILQPYFAAHDFDPFVLSAADLAGSPALSLVTSGCDVLRDEALAWSEHLKARGVQPRHLHFRVNEVDRGW